MIWVASLEEIEADHERIRQGVGTASLVDCDARIAFHDSDQAAVKVMGPTSAMIGLLMHGGFVRRVRCVGECPQTGRPILEGSGEIMGPMSYDDAVAFVAWKDLPRGCNNFAVLTTADLPRIDGCLDRARKFRDAWRLEEAA